MVGEELESRIRELVMEVISRYFNRRILAVFTGGTIGREEVRRQLLRCRQEYGWQVDLLFSRAGAKVHDVERLAQEFQGQVFVEGQNRVSRWKEYAVLVFAVLTRNTAAKAAHLLLDSYAPELLIDALMYGLPVVAVQDAAYPEGEEWKKLGLNRANEELKRALQDHLRRLESYGVRLCRAEELGRVLEEVLSKPPGSGKAASGRGRPRLEGKIITAEDLTPYLDQGTELEVPGSCVLTPLASDLLRKYQIKLVRRQ
ncbi:MAG: hypothetical protein ACPL5F_04385 [Moorellaceae bacterium]